MIGSASDVSAANVIAYNSGDGVLIVSSFTRQNQIRGNSIHDNGAAGIDLQGGANDSISPPVIAGTGPIHGTACPTCVVDIYSDSADEGASFEGSANADGSGNWTYPAQVAGPHVTATTTNTYNNTSEFSTAVSLVSPKPDGRIRKGTGAYGGNNIYNLTGANQTKTGSASVGHKITFGVSAQNDSAASDSLVLQATGAAAPAFSVTYFRGATDITSSIVAGTYTTPALAAGATFLITVKVLVKASAAPGSSVTRLVTISSATDSTKQDAVKFIGKRV